MSLLLGCIADDFTGATDLAGNLVRAGMRTVQLIGAPAPGDPVPDADAVVVALKSRTAPVAEAVADSLASARWLRAAGAPQLYFKVCSTFDSTPAGNIGPVALALADLVGAAIVPVTPAFPEAGRTVFQGHLFVGSQLLSDSPMRQHPLTPMTDANLVRVLQAQLPAGVRVGLVDHRTVAAGAPAIAAGLDALAGAEGAGCRFAIVDTVDDDALRRLAAAAQGLPLVVAGSGLAIGIPALHGLAPGAAASALPPAAGAAAIVSGSCSAATQAQVARFLAGGGAAFAVDPLRIAAGDDVAAQALDWAAPRLGDAPLLVYATAAPEAVQRVQAQLGAAEAGALVEATLARIAAGLVQRGVGRLVVAGGETSGACVQALGITRLRIGPQIAPGVPWCHAASALRSQGLHLALKSGNFGRQDFFRDAFGALVQ
ncbi:MAG: four-carbon acid sugar kinase family protein [Rubrivivax sp.]|nr:four-carbon acid sugar kinase family protein [Rubrivivax sp.]